jgi:hypothetical protein
MFEFGLVFSILLFHTIRFICILQWSIIRAHLKKCSIVFVMSSICPYVRLFVCASVCFSVYLSVCPSVPYFFCAIVSWELKIWIKARDYIGYISLRFLIHYVEVLELSTKSDRLRTNFFAHFSTHFLLGPKNVLSHSFWRIEFPLHCVLKSESINE